MHSMSDMDKIYKVLEKYEVKDAKGEPLELFSWNEDGLYETLRRRVKAYIKSKGPNEHHKSDNFYWVCTAFEILL